MENCEILVYVPYFKGLREDIICSILEYSYVKSLSRGECLFTPEETCDHLYIIKGGMIEIFQIGENGKKIVLHHAARGAFLGDTILFNKGNYGANAYALEDSELLAIDKKSFEELIYIYPEIGIRMLADFGTRIKKLNHFVAGIALNDVRKRIVRLLLDLVGNEKTAGGNAVILSNVPTQDEMAYRIGTVREVLCRELHKLEKEEIISAKRGKIILSDINKLRELVLEEKEEGLFPIMLPMSKMDAIPGAIGVTF